VVHDPSWQDTGVTTPHCAHFAQAIRPSYALMSPFSSASMWCSNGCFASRRFLISVVAMAAKVFGKPIADVAYLVDLPIYQGGYENGVKGV
jgi:hypothetical protein